MKFQVMSPDGIPIGPEVYDTQDKAVAALHQWRERFTGQGYYASVAGRISLEDLPSRCEIVEVTRRGAWRRADCRTNSSAS
jgi:hypothetical protein